MARRYCLDTSVLINSWGEHYRKDVFPGVWETLEEMIASGQVISCIEVFTELERQRDELLDWAKARKQMFETPTQPVIQRLAELMQAYPNFAAAGGTANAADPWLIAHATVTETVVVTFEEWKQTKATKPPKIPNVCDDVGVPWLSPIDFFAETGFNFGRG
jgi:predicted nucleic acid-binding protein